MMSFDLKLYFLVTVEDGCYVHGTLLSKFVLKFP